MRTMLFTAVTLLAAAAGPAFADNYVVDPAHTSVTFKVSHLGLSWTHGRFNEASGAFSIDPANPAKTTFSFAIKADSIDTGNTKRDDHLRSPDFFNVKQYPAITFQSSSVQPAQDGYEVTGNLTLHGVTKPVTLTLVGGRTAEFPAGVQRTGYSTELVLTRSEFGMDKMTEAIGDKVFISISFEGTKK
ncbi:YceI family protein [Planctomicrobium piriforme]|uniref:Polyisoprenoid-binding protein YceI n=1 Tax=Planctomicrobium piriforme TaxID=1576369 RepID=A0A1I3RMX2_9PLAN|nr:YceI family protein [Planctomicrobium piriforme]SFJ46651.1 Polyisoprenoid-binding protein YceI [Planctomicrobium piriforme]